MTAAKQFKFKTNRTTGKYRAFSTPWHDIKLNGFIVGSIVQPDLRDTPADCWHIRLMVVKTDDITDANPNCPWRWVTLKHTAASLEDAQQWLNRADIFEKLTTKYTLAQEVK